MDEDSYVAMFENARALLESGDLNEVLDMLDAPALRHYVRLAATPIAILFFLSVPGHFLLPRRFLAVMQGLPFRSLHRMIVFFTGVIEAYFVYSCVADEPTSDLYMYMFTYVMCVSVANVNRWLRNIEIDGVRWTGWQHFFRGLFQVLILSWISVLHAVCLVIEAMERLAALTRTERPDIYVANEARYAIKY